MTVLTNETAVYAGFGFLALLLFAFVRSQKGSSVRFEVVAQTLYPHKDHTYRFLLKKMNGYYRCYITRAPIFPGKKPKYYMQGYETDPKNNTPFIIWRGEPLRTVEAAKNNCRGWANANQLLMDYQRTPD